MKQSITIKFNLWIIVAILALSNLITLALWQPWNGFGASNRTITINGTTTIEAEADQYTFTPYYQKTGTDSNKINNNLSSLSKTIVEKLKKLGVSDSSIKTDVSSYDYGIYYYDDSSNVSGTLSVTVTLKDKALAQKVQDYLATTSASGSISPQISFSITKQKELETQAREEALTDAKTKAEATAKQLGVTIGKAISVNESTSGGVTPLPWLYDAVKSNSGSSEEPATDTSSSYTIQPGLNEYSFSVEVTYELK